MVPGGRRNHGTQGSQGAVRTTRCLRRLAYLAAAALAWVLAGNAAGADIRCVPASDGNPRYVLYNGSVVREDPQMLRAKMGECFPTGANFTPTLWLNSGGGLVHAGLEMAHDIIQYSSRRPVRVMVAPGGRCISACTFIFISGEFREVPPVATFEPHGFSSWLGTSPAKVEKWSARDPNLRRLWTAVNHLGAHFEDEGLSTKPLEPLRDALRSESDNAYSDAQKAFFHMPRAYRDIVVDWDSVLQVTITEIERQVALRTLLGATEDEPAQERAEEVDRRSSALANRLTTVLDRNLKKSRQGRKTAAETSAGQAIKELISSQIEQTTDAAIKLGRLMNRRKGDIDIRALTNFMFSTSILYVRPLTREELCDSNVMNVGC